MALVGRRVVDSLNERWIFGEHSRDKVLLGHLLKPGSCPPLNSNFYLNLVITKGSASCDRAEMTYWLECDIRQSPETTPVNVTDDNSFCLLEHRRPWDVSGP